MWKLCWCREASLVTEQYKLPRVAFYLVIFGADMARFTAWMWDLPVWASVLTVLQHGCTSCICKVAQGTLLMVQLSSLSWFWLSTCDSWWEHGICPLAGPYTQLDIILPRYSLTPCHVLINILLPVTWNDAQHPCTGRGESERSAVADFLLFHSWKYLPQISWGLCLFKSTKLFSV